MFKLKVYNKEEKDFIYKIMNLDLGYKTEEIYIKLPISEKEYITKLYDPYVVFNLYKMMSIGGDCYIDGDVSKSLLDNLKKINYKKLLNIISIVSSLDIAIVATVIGLTNNFWLEMIIGCFLTIFLILISYYIVGKIYKKHGYCK